MRPSDHDLFRKTPIFQRVGADVMDRIARGSFVEALPRGAILFLQGDMPEFVHLVLEGRIGLGAEDAAGNATIVELFAAGQLFIVPAAILNKPYLLTARVAADARVLMIPVELFRRALAAEHALALALVDLLATHWRLLVRQIKDLKLRSASERLASHLAAHLTTQEGPATLRLEEELRVVAARLGMTPESLSRAFTALRAVGVQSRGRNVHIADVAKLRAHCGYEDVD
jgi:CRP/FNR family transcriptional activator FtrB